MKKRVGLIGFGVIGKYLYEKLSADGVEFAFVYDKLATGGMSAVKVFTNSFESVERQCQKGVDLVIEAAAVQAVVETGPTILKYADMLIFSLCSFADQAFADEIESTCKTYDHRVFIPHGAILGLDGIQDGRDILEAVSITTTKRPESLGRKEQVRTVLYEGPTREACRLYSRNVNVHAGVALAGLGFDKTVSRIVADPAAAGNTHVIEIKAKGCGFKVEVVSEPVAGVTGAYTPVSAYSAARRILSGPSMVIV